MAEVQDNELQVRDYLQGPGPEVGTPAEASERERTERENNNNSNTEIAGETQGTMTIEAYRSLFGRFYSLLWRNRCGINS